MYEKFEKLLKERGVKPSDVADATGIKKPTFTAWKNGKYTPKADKIQKIAEYFGVPVSYFYEEDVIPGYYYNEDVQELAEEMALKPGLRVLFDASRDLSEDSLKMFAEMIETFKKTNG